MAKTNPNSTIFWKFRIFVKNAQKSTMKFYNKECGTPCAHQMDSVVLLK